MGGVREAIGVPDRDPGPEPDPTIAALTHAAASALNAADAALAAASEALSSLSGAVEALLAHVAANGAHPKAEGASVIRPPDCDGTHRHAIDISTHGKTVWLCPDHGEVEKG